jgi:hypothetical protein
MGVGWKVAQPLQKTVWQVLKPLNLGPQACPLLEISLRYWGVTRQTTLLKSQQARQNLLLQKDAHREFWEVHTPGGKSAGVLSDAMLPLLPLDRAGFGLTVCMVG